jgi:AmmeMemoRadiSam system radical SAM enzyme/AmmeMemoRadiSam system protein B/AmmeMemoRadiSam system protein A
MRKVVLPPAASDPQSGTIAGGWWHETEESGRIVCDLCPRECNLKPGDRGFCFVRQNVDGELRLTTYGRSTGFCIDPIEKKPLNHFFPGTPVLSFGTAGCNLGCKFCQNWDISKSREVERLSELALPDMIAAAAVETGCRSVAYTYNDPIIWAEYAIDTAAACRDRGIKSVAVTAGYISPEARPTFFHAMDAANIDLKAFTEEFYHRVTYSHLQPVLDTLTWLKQDSDVWFEITNLIIPDANDSPDELRQMCDWILEAVGADVPVHFTAFHPDFRMMDSPATPHETLLQAKQIAIEQGLRFAYVGNVQDVQNQSTYCPACHRLLIERDWHLLGTYGMNHNRCGSCGEIIPGHFDMKPGTWGRKRQPIRISDYVQNDRSAESRPATENTMQAVTDSPNLTTLQESAIHKAACEIVAAAAAGKQPNLTDESVASAADTIVMGAFVTVRRDGHLRSCCGSLGKPMQLLAALKAAGYRTAVDDPRFPPLSPNELSFLDLDVTLLFNFQPVTEQGEARVAAIEIGKHGLRIQSGGKAGLLLPCVPVEQGWDARTFLNQVCRKAGLPISTWQQADSELLRFEGRMIEGRFESAADAEQRGRSLPDQQQLEVLRQFAESNLRASVSGAVPACFPGDCEDGTVDGMALQVTHGSSGQSMTLSKVQLRGGLPLQMTLLELTQSAAQRIPPQSVDEIRVDLCLLNDSAMHGTVENPDLRGVDPASCVVMVTHSGCSAWVFDSGVTPQALLDHAVTIAQAKNHPQAGVYSFFAVCTASSMEMSNVPKADVRTSSRPAALAGRFYPDDIGELNALLDQCLEPIPARTQRWPAVMVPHAGLVYSGRVAGDVLKQIEIPESVIILGPKHTRNGVDWAVGPHDEWRLPNANMAGDLELAKRLADQIDGLELDAAAHAQEHAIEVELPLLARLAPAARVVGIAIGGGTLSRCLRFGQQLAEVIKQMPTPPLLVISSDMNHFATDSENRRLDEIALDAMESLDPATLHEVVTSNAISMCGVLPAVIVMEALRCLDQLATIQRVSYATSADVTHDKSRVVGYAGMFLG